jgi:putative transposase
MKDRTKYKSNNNVVYSCKYHIIWCPKYRRKVLVGEVETRLKQLIQQIALELSVELIEMETDQDHIQVLVDVDPQFGVNKFVRILKGRTSRILREEFPYLKKRLPTLWTNSYFVSTVGGAPLAVIKQYIENQQISESKKSKQRWATFLDNGKKEKLRSEQAEYTEFCT